MEACREEVYQLHRPAKEGIDFGELLLLCKEDEELTDHILLHCSKAKIMWNMVFFLFWNAWVTSSLVGRLLFG